MGKNFLLVDLLLLSVLPFMQAIPYVRSFLFAIDSFVHPSYSPEPSITPAAPPHTNRSFSSLMPYSSTLPHLFFSPPLSVSYFSHCFSSFSGQAPPQAERERRRELISAHASNRPPPSPPTPIDLVPVPQRRERKGGRLSYLGRNFFLLIFPPEILFCIARYVFAISSHT